ncbi:hypothetical protein ACFQZ1_09950 [Bacillus sp. CGMCC 1.60114]|uniref:hypothetical protein n=1 Tax=unclassified Bacillus (in: firmicutes) TaxID=185979 RepID=UPI00364435BF
MHIKKLELIADVLPGHPFSTENMPEGTRHLQWEIGAIGDLEAISFDVIEDISGGIDYIIFKHVLHKNRTKVVRKKSLYIENVKNAPSKVKIQVYAIIYE